MAPIEVRSDLPSGTCIIGAFGLGSRLWGDPGPIRWRRDPWPGSSLPEPAATERRRALDHLAGLLDAWCEATTVHGVPLDPDRVWRDPKIAASDHGTLRYVADQRLVLTVARPQDAIVVHVS